jgi:hypothetical protein
MPSPFGRAELVSPRCPRCTDHEFLASGGAILALRREPKDGRFPLGKVTVTPGAVEALGEAAQHASEFLARHAHGDWGGFGHFDQITLTADERQRGWEATDDSGKINKVNVLNGRDSVMSEYKTNRGRRLWVITSLGRAISTTVLLPEEY